MNRAAFVLAAAALLAACDRVAAPPAAEALANVQAKAAPAGFPVLSGRVVDSAGLIPPGDEARLVRALESLERRTTDQLVIVTVESLGGRSIEEYGVSLGNQWGVGQEDKDNGVLLIVAPSERKTRIEVGYGLEPILTNQRAAEIIERELVPNFREGKYSAGIEVGAIAIIDTLVAHESEPRRGR